MRPSPEIRRRHAVLMGAEALFDFRAAERDADEFDPPRQFRIDFLHGGAFLELVGGCSEAGDEEREQEAEPEEQADADGRPEHAAHAMQYPCPRRVAMRSQAIFLRRL